MDGMILAAGLGTRLQPLTDDIPKALVPVRGVPVLELVARRLITAGVDRLVINTHHHAEQITAFVRGRDGFGVSVDFSHEAERPMDTGGGIKRAAGLFRRDGPILVHNVDVLSGVDLSALVRVHRAAGALATLAVRRPAGGRYVLVSGTGRFCGYGSRDGGQHVVVGCDDETGLGRATFCGIQVLDPTFPERITEDGVFSIIYVYARLAGSGEAVQTYDIGHAPWMDIGTHEDLAIANQLPPSGDLWPFSAAS